MVNLGLEFLFNAPEEQPEPPGPLELAANLALQMMFLHEEPNGQVTSSLLGPSAAPPPQRQAGPSQAEAQKLLVQAIAKQQLQAKGGATAPETSLATFSDAAKAVITPIWAPYAGKLDALAIHWNLIPTPEELLGSDFKSVHATANLFRRLRETAINDQGIQQEIALHTNAVVGSVGLVKNLQADGSANDRETLLAMEEVQNQISQMLAKREGVLAKCPACGQTECHCGYSGIDVQAIIESSIAKAKQTNATLAHQVVSSAIIDNKQAMAATELSKTLKEKGALELLHISPGKMLVAAFLSDWKQVIPALLSNIGYNEAGHKGTSIILEPAPLEHGGPQLIISTAALGKADSKPMPINSLRLWQQPDWQSWVSDSPQEQKKWAESSHGTVPEVGVLTIANPAAPAFNTKIPLAIRFPAAEHKRSGGAAIIPHALLMYNSVTNFVNEITTALNIAKAGAPKSDAEIGMRAQAAGKTALVQQGVRPFIVAKTVEAMLGQLKEQPDQAAAMRNFASNAVLLEEFQVTATEKVGHDLAILVNSMHNLEAGLTYKAYRGSVFDVTLADKSSLVIDTNRDKPVKRERVEEQLQRGVWPENWKVKDIPDEKYTYGIIRTALQALHELQLPQAAWEQLYSGKMKLDVTDETLLTAMKAELSPEIFTSLTSPAPAAPAEPTSLRDNIGVKMWGTEGPPWKRKSK